MASELRVNTLKDASGNNSIATSFVAGGSAKAWVNFNGESTLSVRDSLNIGSVTDNGTGNYTNNFSSAFAAATYNTTGAGGGNLMYLDTSYGYTTSAKTFRSAYPSSTAGNITLADANDVNASHHGDLA